MIRKAVWNHTSTELFIQLLQPPSLLYCKLSSSLPKCQVMWWEVEEEGGEPTSSSCWVFFLCSFRSVPPLVKLPGCNNQPVIWTTSNLTSRKLLLTVITEIRKYPACLCFTLLMTAYLQHTRRKQSDLVEVLIASKQNAGQEQSVPLKRTKKRVYSKTITGNNCLVFQWSLCTLTGTVIVFVKPTDQNDSFKGQWEWNSRGALLYILTSHIITLQKSVMCGQPTTSDYKWQRMQLTAM